MKDLVLSKLLTSLDVGIESIELAQEWVLVAMDAHGEVLVSMLWRILGNEQDVCDAYQDTFLRLTHCRQGQKPDHIKAYLFRTATNVAINTLRKKKTRQNAFQEMVKYKTTVELTEPSSRMDQNYMAEKLRENIARLPEHLRQVVVLHDLGEMKYSQVAKTLGISTGSARVLRCRAIQLLSVWMNKAV